MGKAQTGGGWARGLVAGLVSIFALGAAGLLWAQGPSQRANVPHGTVARIQVPGKSLAGNLDGDAAERYVCVYLPPSYAKNRHRRYPVIYFLHGFTDDDAGWYGLHEHWIDLPAIVDQALAKGESREMILVTPNAYTRFAGSMYSDSADTGDWESYVADDLVRYMDSHYRTIPSAASRGLAGHSMGGYGALRIAMKKPGVFSSVYLLSPCCLTAGPGPRMNDEALAAVEAIHSDADFQKAGFYTKVIYASAAAWSPDPKNPPFFLDLPTGDAGERAAVGAKWAANAPLAMIDQYVASLRGLEAIAFDGGTEDALTASLKILDSELNEYGIAHGYEVYPGTHTSGIAVRLETKTLPFFSKNLSFR